MEMCALCGRVPNRHLSMEDGTSMSICWDCYNEWYCERVGLISSLYDHPEQITVLRHIFFIKYQVMAYSVRYIAIEDPKRGHYLFYYDAPCKMDGFTATEQLRKVIARGVREQILEGGDTLAEKGSFEIIEDENDPHKIAVVIDGKAYGSEEFLSILANSEGFNMTYKLEESTHRLDAASFARAQDIEKNLLFTKG